jgi:hypothetical protein
MLSVPDNAVAHKREDGFQRPVFEPREIIDNTV